MRVIAGRLGGRNFASPHGHRTHPMSEKMRGALFNILGDISGDEVIDAFSGSGALALEAVSRGAASVIAVEHDLTAQRAVRENIALLGVDAQVTLIPANVRSWLNRHPDAHFDLILLDPPYDHPQHRILAKVADRLRPGGRLVLSWPGGERSPHYDGLVVTTVKQYGDASLHVYHKPLE